MQRSGSIVGLCGRLSAAAVLAALLPAAASARDEPPLPFPLPCPLDVPVRVASEDTLKRFTALDDCTADLVIAAPLDRPRPARAPVEIEPTATPGSDDRIRVVRAERRPKRRIGDTSVETAELAGSGTRVVRIIPTLPEPDPVTIAMPVAAEAGPVATAGVVPAALDAGVSLAPSDELLLGMRPASYAGPFDALITNAAVRHRVDPLMLHSVIRQESSYRPGAVSRSGARGLMQIMPGTGSDLGVSNPAYLMDPATNIDAGARLLRRLWTRMNGRFDLVLAAYNAGEGAVRRFGMAVPPFAETRAYVARVQGIYRGLAVGAGLLEAR